MMALPLGCSSLPPRPALGSASAAGGATTVAGTTALIREGVLVGVTVTDVAVEVGVGVCVLWRCGVSVLVGVAVGVSVGGGVYVPVGVAVGVSVGGGV
jgi:hypothetical protein